MIDALQALNANPFTASIGSVKDKATQDVGTDIASFASVMSSMADNMVSNIKSAETTSTQGILGKASVREVADAVMTADQTLQTAMAFRDKIVSAYLEIIKMPI